MNKPITNDLKIRAQKCVVEMKNKVHFYESTGMHFGTLERILEREWADESQLAIIEKYCDEVEGVKTDKAA